jgi:glycosyltransferase involved in cell wall biosynthesis
MKATDGFVLIPAYQEGCRIGAVVREVLPFCPRIVVVDDGSADDTAEVARAAGATVLVHAHNRGKGAALQTGFDYAREQGAAFVLTMDGDGQHAPADIPGFLEAFARGEAPVLVGNRMEDPRAMPFVRRMTNRFMSWMLSRKMGQRVPDTQNGFRLYRTDVLPNMSGGDARFAAESEILLILSRRSVRIGSVPVRIIYGDERSKIRPVRDTLRFFRMLRAFDRKAAEGTYQGKRI